MPSKNELPPRETKKGEEEAVIAEQDEKRNKEIFEAYIDYREALFNICSEADEFIHTDKNKLIHTDKDVIYHYIVDKGYLIKKLASDILEEHDPIPADAGDNEED